MLTSLSYSVTFPSTGQTFSANIQPASGFTAITGQNESGKSMIFEMIRYLLFGTRALRGASDDYKTLTAQGSFKIKGKVVDITRVHGAGKVTMSRNGEVVATGTKAVNAKVVQELGFGMKVFDTACNIKQGDVEALGDMQPTERKAMVESVLGLAVLDNIGKWALDEAKIRDKQAESLRERLTPPGLPPVKPSNYEASALLQERLVALRADCDELATINGFLSVTKTKPVKPECKIQMPSEQLAAFATQRAQLRETIAGLRATSGALPSEAPWTEGQLAIIEQGWKDYHAYADYKAWLQRNPPSPWTSVTQLEVFRDDWTALANIAEFDRLDAQILDLEAKGAKPCPHCGEDIALEADAIELLKAKRDALEVPCASVTISDPPIPLRDIDAAIAYLRTYEPRPAVAEAVAPLMPEHEIPKHRAAITQVAERAVIIEQLAAAEKKFDAMPDFEGQLAERRSYETLNAAYLAEFLGYETWQAEAATKTMRQAALKGAPEAYAAATAALSLATLYEAEEARFRTTSEAYVRELEVIERFEAEAEEHRAVRTVMADLRGRIKSFVLPSLTKVSSHLLYQMTGGQRQLIKIDDEFNVVVDSQPLQTLSGSGKACANLAIRIALGQVLTNKVISLLMADEIDASMDDFRAENTALSIGSLNSTIEQILLISHKNPSAEQIIRLGTSDDTGTEQDR
jgi:hypothetical protein